MVKLHYEDYNDQAVDLAIALSNAFHPSSAARTLTTAGAAFIAAHEVLLREHHVKPRRLTAQDLDEFEDLAMRIRRVVDEPDDASAIEQLNGLLECCETAPRVVINDGTATLLYAPDHSDCLDWIAANAAMGLAQAIITHGRERLGRCAAESCDNVFVDASKNRTRRYCSDTCASRTTVRALRERRRRAAAGATG